MDVRSIDLTIEELRKEAMLQSKELADLAGVSVQTLYRLEHGRPVTEIFARKVLGVLGQRLARKIAIEDVTGIVISDDKRGRYAR